VNLGRYIKALIPASGGVLSLVENWALTGKLDVPHFRYAVVLELVAFLVYLFPNTPAPVVTPPVVPVEPPLPVVVPVEPVGVQTAIVGGTPTAWPGGA